jgi:hypothetical protein
MKIAIPVFSAPGNRSRASAYPAGTAVASVIATTHPATTMVFTTHTP